MARNFEYRRAVPGIELRSNDDGTVSLIGYASTFGEPYDMGTYTETVKRGAFKETLGRQPDVRFLVNHDGLPLARTASGTLRLSEDERGLRMEADLNPADPDVQSLLPKIERGDLNQMSFGFRISANGQEWSTDSEGVRQRALTNLNLADGDVSVVTYPANPGTSIGVRSITGEPDVRAAIALAIHMLEQGEDRDVIAATFRSMLSPATEEVSADEAEAVGAEPAAEEVVEPESTEDTERASALAAAAARRRTIAGL